MMPESRVAAAFTEAQAARVARDLYGLEVQARSLPGEYDDNFHLSPSEGPGFVLKVMHPARERGLIALQCRVLSHLATRAPEVSLPRLCPTRTGEVLATTLG